MLTAILVLSFSQISAVPCSTVRDCLDAGFAPDGGLSCQQSCPAFTTCGTTVNHCCSGPGSLCETDADCCGDVVLVCQKTSPIAPFGTCCNAHTDTLYGGGPCAQSADCCGVNYLDPNAEAMCNLLYGSCSTCFTPVAGVANVGCEWDAGLPNPNHTDGPCCPGLTCITYQHLSDAGSNGESAIECCSYLGQPCAPVPAGTHGFERDQSTCCEARDVDPKKHNYDPINITCGSRGVCCERKGGKCRQNSDCCGWNCSDAGVCACN
jgi:hypothetical protein